MSEPVRRCAGCGTKRKKSELLRIVRLPGEKSRVVRFDPEIKLEGRSLYFCATRKCFETLMRRKAPEKLLKEKLPEEVREAINGFLSHTESATMS